MNINQGLNISQNQSQTQTLGPMQVMSIKIAQLNTQSLVERINFELRENPFLEVKETEENKETEEDKKDEKHESEDTEDGEKIKDGSESNSDDSEDYLPTFSSINTENDTFSPLDIASAENSLYEKLVNIIEISCKTESQINIAKTILDYCDKNGFLEIDLMEIAENNNIDIVEIKNVLLIMQKALPSGFAARNIEECLIMQLEDLNINEPILIEKEKFSQNFE